MYPSLGIIFVYPRLDIIFVYPRLGIIFVYPRLASLFVVFLLIYGILSYLTADRIAFKLNQTWK